MRNTNHTCFIQRTQDGLDPRVRPGCGTVNPCSDGCPSAHREVRPPISIFYGSYIASTGGRGSCRAESAKGTWMALVAVTELGRGFWAVMSAREERRSLHSPTQRPDLSLERGLPVLPYGPFRPRKRAIAQNRRARTDVRFTGDFHVLRSLCRSSLPRLGGCPESLLHPQDLSCFGKEFRKRPPPRIRHFTPQPKVEVSIQ